MELIHIFSSVITIMIAYAIFLFYSVSKSVNSKSEAETRMHVQDAVLSITFQSIALAEQMGMRYKKDSHGEKMDPDYKLQIATEYMINEIRRTRLPELSINQIQQKIEAYLGVGALNISHHGGDENAISYDD